MIPGFRKFGQNSGLMFELIFVSLLTERIMRIQIFFNCEFEI